VAICVLPAKKVRTGDRVKTGGRLRLVFQQKITTAGVLLVLAAGGQIECAPDTPMQVERAAVVVDLDDAIPQRTDGGIAFHGLGGSSQG
jgi:hypothetical protein